ncbi:hypothetical protein HK100_011543 [Physocladia obscura]|uniref:Uncharacterized protein n=1 Tax=Physocladia obscura TaxID=109957 RepID=A0AAD5T728_9FUNG|nr:hypothetical protein HK100_011543 [Physocladia obscura]
MEGGRGSMDTVSTARPVLPYSAYSTPSPPPSVASGRTGGSSTRNSKTGIINGFNNNVIVSANSNHSDYSSRSNSRRRAGSDVVGGEPAALDSPPTAVWAATTGRLNSRSSSRASVNNTLGSGTGFLSTLFAARTESMAGGDKNGNGGVMRKMRNFLVRQKPNSDSQANNNSKNTNNDNNNNNNYHNNNNYYASSLSSPTTSSSPVSPAPPLPYQHFHAPDVTGSHHHNLPHSEGTKSVAITIAANNINANASNVGSAANVRSLSPPQPLIALGPRQLMAHIALMSNDNDNDSPSSRHSLSSTNSNDSDSLLPTDSSIESPTAFVVSVVPENLQVLQPDLSPILGFDKNDSQVHPPSPSRSERRVSFASGEIIEQKPVSSGDDKSNNNSENNNESPTFIHKVFNRNKTKRLSIAGNMPASAFPPTTTPAVPSQQKAKRISWSPTFSAHAQLSRPGTPVSPSASQPTVQLKSAVKQQPSERHHLQLPQQQQQQYQHYQHQQPHQQNQQLSRKHATQPNQIHSAVSLPPNFPNIVVGTFDDDAKPLKLIQENLKKKDDFRRSSLDFEPVSGVSSITSSSRSNSAADSGSGSGGIVHSSTGSHSRRGSGSGSGHNEKRVSYVAPLSTSNSHRNSISNSKRNSVVMEISKRNSSNDLAANVSQRSSSTNLFDVSRRTSSASIGSAFLAPQPILVQSVAPPIAGILPIQQQQMYGTQTQILVQQPQVTQAIFGSVQQQQQLPPQKSQIPIYTPFSGLAAPVMFAPQQPLPVAPAAAGFVYYTSGTQLSTQQQHNPNTLIRFSEQEYETSSTLKVAQKVKEDLEARAIAEDLLKQRGEIRRFN